jgi:hypothetical protein
MVYFDKIKNIIKDLGNNRNWSFEKVGKFKRAR